MSNINLAKLTSALADIEAATTPLEVARAVPPAAEALAELAPQITARVFGRLQEMGCGAQFAGIKQAMDEGFAALRLSATPAVTAGALMAIQRAGRAPGPDGPKPVN